jgi:sigma-E factor negative regulatory protein RseC
MTEIGRVVAVDSDAVWVETRRRGSCGSCTARGACGHGLLSAEGGRPQLLRATLAPDGPRALNLNDTVCVSLPESRFLRGVGLLYLLPLATTVSAAVLASAYGGDTPATADLRAALAAAVGLAVGLVVLRWLSGRGAPQHALHPVVTARLESQPTPPVAGSPINDH